MNIQHGRVYVESWCYVSACFDFANQVFFYQRVLFIIWYRIKPKIGSHMLQ